MEDLDREEFCYITTVGRRTAKPHTIEIWFAARGDTLYILAGGGQSADWVQNIQADPSAVVKIGDHAYCGMGRILSEKDEVAWHERSSRRNTHTGKMGSKNGLSALFPSRST